MSASINQESRRIKRAIILFIIGLIISGLTAFPIESEIEFILKFTSLSPFLEKWLNTIYEAVLTTNRSFPYLAYGTDWLGFAHILFAILFIGALEDPVKNKWVIQFGMIACILIFPLAFIAGYIRSIPIFWRMIDCSFGIIGILPLWYSYNGIKRIEKFKNLKNKLSYNKVLPQL